MAVRMAEWLEEEHEKLTPLMNGVRKYAFSVFDGDAVLKLVDHIEHLAEECRKLTPEK